MSQSKQSWESVFTWYECFVCEQFAYSDFWIITINREYSVPSYIIYHKQQSGPDEKYEYWAYDCSTTQQ